MIKKLTQQLKEEKLKTQNEEQVFNFKEKHEGIAGNCPDCGEIVSYNSFFHRYVCANLECEFEADISRRRIVRKFSTSQQTEFKKL